MAVLTGRFPNNDAGFVDIYTRRGICNFRGICYALRPGGFTCASRPLHKPQKA